MPWNVRPSYRLLPAFSTTGRHIPGRFRVMETKGKFEQKVCELALVGPESVNELCKRGIPTDDARRLVNEATA